MESTSTRDFTKGFPVDDLQNGGMIQGKVTDEDVILARHADEFFAVGAGCTHYVEGLIVGDELRCPLDHACFSLRTGMGSVRTGIRGTKTVQLRCADVLDFQGVGSVSTCIPELSS